MTVPAIEQLTTRALTAALDAASLRQQVIASNIANAGVPGHRPQRVHFEATLSAATAATGGVDLRARVEPAAPAGSGGTSLDAEVAALAENTVHQQVMLRALQRHLALLATAASDGRR